MASKAFFTKLKETCQKIDNDMTDIKTKMITSQDDHNKEEVASRKICEIQDKIHSVKTEASDLKSMLGPKLAHTRVFIKNFKELMVETEVSISKKEECLKLYGYIPVESVPQDPGIIAENSKTPDKKVKNLPVTPNLLDYGISLYTLTSTPELKQKSSIESLNLPYLESSKSLKSNSHSDSTPTLDVAAIISTSKSKETPPLPEPLYTPVKETPPIPESLAYSSSNFPSTPKLNI